MDAGGRPWKVVQNCESGDGPYCVDIFVRADESFGFEHFRRDVEDGGAWTPVGGYSGRRFDSGKIVEGVARTRVTCLTVGCQ